MHRSHPLATLGSILLLLATVGCDAEAPRESTDAQSSAAQSADAARSYDAPLPPVPGRAEDVQPLDTGAAAPTAVLLDAQDNAADVGVFYANGPTMLVFYRGGWCPFCTAHLSELAANEAALRELGVQILAVSPDRPEKLAESLAALEQLSITPGYRLLSDPDMALARKFGVAFRVDDATVAQYLEHGLDLADAAGRDHQMLPVPAVFLIDREGVIRFAHWNADYKQRLGGEALIAAAEGLPRE